MVIRYSTFFDEDNEVICIKKVKLTTEGADIVPTYDSRWVVLFDTEGESTTLYIPQNKDKIIDISKSYIEPIPYAVITNQGYNGFIIPQVNWILDNTL